MTLALYWDLETTGFRDPWIMEYAGLLVETSSDTEVWRASGLVALPPGATVEAGAYAVHGLTAEACASGISSGACCALFWSQCAKAELLVGYYIQSDMDVMTKASAHSGVGVQAFPRPVDLKDWATPLCQLPPTERMRRAGRNHFKTPSLVEAMSALAPEHDYKPHRALSDVLATRLLHRRIKEKLDAAKAEA